MPASDENDEDPRVAERLERIRMPGSVVDSDGVSPAENSDEIRRSVGRRIREAREKRGMSVRQLAAAADVTPGMISQVERGAVMPSIATLLRIAAGLRLHIGDFFATPSPVGRVVRVAQRAPYDYPLTGVHDELISSDPTGKLQVFYSRLEPGATSGSELLEHGSDAEFVLVLSGAVEILLGDEVVELDTGDTLSFAGETPHGFRNPGDVQAELVWVVTPAAY